MFGQQELAVYECGSEQAYQAHCRRGEPLDEACRAAHARLHRERRATSAYKIREASKRAAMQALIHRHRAEYQALLAAALREATAEAEAG